MTTGSPFKNQILTVNGRNYLAAPGNTLDAAGF
jgi:hypothetical protein